MRSYSQLKDWRKKTIHSVSCDFQKLSTFHDDLMNRTVQIAIEKVESEWGKPPTHFAFFVMGSAGRMEQSVWSDQDHGIVWTGSGDFQNYFLRLGAEITNGLAIVGYEQCEGNVMAQNPLWCKSTSSWQQQIQAWLHEADWESLRYFTTFFDSRVLVGDDELLFNLKNVAFAMLALEPALYKRLYENVGFVKKGMGIFGQLLPEEKGDAAGTINLKQTIFFPYVNSLRLLAMLEQIPHSATIDRFNLLPKSYQSIKEYQADFLKLLDYRLYYQKNASSYQKVHLLPVKSMNAREKEALKEMMKRGRRLFRETKDIINQRCSL